MHGLRAVFEIMVVSVPSIGENGCVKTRSDIPSFHFEVISAFGSGIIGAVLLPEYRYCLTYRSKLYWYHGSPKRRSMVRSREHAIHSLWQALRLNVAASGKEIHWTEIPRDHQGCCGSRWVDEPSLNIQFRAYLEPCILLFQSNDKQRVVVSAHRTLLIRSSPLVSLSHWHRVILPSESATAKVGFSKACPWHLLVGARSF